MQHEIRDDYHNETYYPVDTQPGCDRNCADCTPADCEHWRKSRLLCPACLEFKERAYPLSKYKESALYVHKDGRFICVCAGCGESYEDTAAVASRALDNLKDVLDDQDCLKSQMEAKGVAA